MINMTLTRSIEATPLRQGLTGFWASLTQRAAKRRLYRETLGELGALSDRDLADIGIHRSIVREVARDATYIG